MIDNDSDVEEDTTSSKEFLADLNVEFHDKALLANPKRFHKRSRRVGAARKPMDKSKETCFACGKQGHFQKYFSKSKTSSPSYPSNKTKFQHNHSSSSHQITDNKQNNYKVRYQPLKTKMALLTKKIDALFKQKQDTGLIAETRDHDDESLSSGDEGTTTVRSFMAKQVTEKESLTKSVNKKTQSKTLVVPDLKPEKKADTTTEELLLTLMKEVKGLMEQIKPSSKSSPFFLSNREF
ncbi:retrovirus-related pol polyprotein from transposon TNT 1-94 [Tanacetum coccineum]